ncbi:MAG TPA: hypothetical protein VIV10_02840, partial [Gemmatimonadales bacterium]
VVFDSLAKSGMSAQTLDPIKTALLAGDVQGLAQRFGFGGGGGAGGGGGGGVAAAGGRFVERPGETTPRAPGAAGAAAGAQQQEGGEGAADQPDPTFLGTLGQLIRLPSQRGGGGGGGGFGALGFVAQTFGRAAGGGGGFGGGGANVVQSGNYLVSITIDGKTLSRVLRVERVAASGATVATFDDDDP